VQVRGMEIVPDYMTTKRTSDDMQDRNLQ